MTTFTRRGIVRGVLLAPLAIAATGLARTRRSQPNIVIIVADDMRYDSMGFIDRNVATPALDTFAREAVRFRNAFVTTSICCSSRASIFTGAYASRHGVWDFETDLTPQMRAISYPVALKSLGYTNAFFGKYGLCEYDRTIARFEDRWGATIASRSPDFDIFDSSDVMTRDWGSRPRAIPPESTRSISEKAIRFISNHARGRPFSLSVSFLAPHANDLEADPIGGEYSPEQDMLGEYDSIEGVPLRPTERVEPESRLGIEKHNRTLWQRRFSNPALRLDSLKKYWAMISGVDRAFGRICDALRQQGVYDDSLIIFMSDNGYLMGDYKMDGKLIAYESSIRIPLLIKPPRRTSGTDCMDNVLNIDICPTIIALAGGRPARGCQGLDLSPTWSGAKINRDEFLYEYQLGPNNRSGIRAIRDPRYTYVEYSEGEKRGIYLYDRNQDPNEISDISSRTAKGVLQTFHSRLDALAARYR